ncbi:MAG: hypothetical protein K9M00_05230 [Candidatus Omnitrophica bacterium]|nr:hypothetical protein [Candidatus Omnitrophota bacterium]
MRKARVFISCGQKTEREKKIGQDIKDYLDSRGFNTYFAEKVHSSDALTENIFKFLEKSEYFIFVDFKRDTLPEGEIKGSLFVNQEIAIATFLGIEATGFQEKGVKREGILDYHIYNALPFENSSDIINHLEEQTKKWDCDSVDELDIIFKEDIVDKDVLLNKKVMSDWYHLEIKNRCKKKHAFLCNAYVTKISDRKAKKEIEIPSNELIWAGTGQWVTNILRNSVKELDAFCIREGSQYIEFNQRALLTNNPRYRIPSLPSGEYLLEFTVISSNFENVSKEFILKHKGNRESVEFYPFSNDVK